MSKVLSSNEHILSFDGKVVSKISIVTLAVLSAMLLTALFITYPAFTKNFSKSDTSFVSMSFSVLLLIINVSPVFFMFNYLTDFFKEVKTQPGILNLITKQVDFNFSDQNIEYLNGSVAISTKDQYAQSAASFLTKFLIDDYERANKGYDFITANDVFITYIKEKDTTKIIARIINK